MDKYRVPAHLDFLRGAFAHRGLNPLVTRVRFDESAQRFSVRVGEPYMSWVRSGALGDEATGDLFSVPGDVMSVASRDDIVHLITQRMTRLLEAPNIPSGLLWHQALPEIPGRMPAGL